MTQQERIDKAVAIIMPEAKAIYKQAMEDFTTQNGYGVVLAYLSKLKDKLVGQVLLVALGRLGYPLHSIQSLKQIMGW